MSLGDRIKRYEAVTRAKGTINTPLMIRVDGKAFHTFTKHMQKPFDAALQDAMVYAATEVAKRMQGMKAAYVQSDEATFVITDYDTIETQGWFDYNLSKVISTTAATMSVYFAAAMGKESTSDSLPVFDARAFNIPPADVVNAFLWRAQDWERNSLQMYAQAFFSHRELHKKNREAMHNMLHSVGKNWTNDLTPREKNGTFIINGEDGLQHVHDVLPTYAAINDLIGEML